VLLLDPALPASARRCAGRGRTPVLLLALAALQGCTAELA